MNGGEQPTGTEQAAEQEPDDVLQRVDDVLGRAMPGSQPESVPGEPEEREADDERPAPRIYVASLSDYNAGRLHGRWVDAAQPLDDLWSDIGDMLAESPEPGAEEWAIHDYEGFWPLELHEYESLEFVHQVAEGIVQDGEAFAAFVVFADRDPERLPFFDDLYKGTWESLEAYARHLLQDLAIDVPLDSLPEWIRPYVSIDVDAIVRDWESGSVTAIRARNGDVHVFDFES